jgi:hypothetical protein
LIELAERFLASVERLAGDGSGSGQSTEVVSA